MDIKVFVDAVNAAADWYGVKVDFYSFKDKPDTLAIYSKGKCMSVILTPYENPDKTLKQELSDELDTELGVYTVSKFMLLPPNFKTSLMAASEVIAAIFSNTSIAR